MAGGGVAPLLSLLAPPEVVLLSLRDRQLRLNGRWDVAAGTAVTPHPVLLEVVRPEVLLAHGALDGDVRALRIARRELGALGQADRQAKCVQVYYSTVRVELRARATQ